MNSLPENADDGDPAKALYDAMITAHEEDDVTNPAHPGYEPQDDDPATLTLDDAVTFRRALDARLHKPNETRE